MESSKRDGEKGAHQRRIEDSGGKSIFHSFREAGEKYQRHYELIRYAGKGCPTWLF
jgi:hypothetical protein